MVCFGEKGKKFFVWGNIGGMWTIGVDLGLLLLFLSGSTTCSVAGD